MFWVTMAWYWKYSQMCFRLNLPENLDLDARLESVINFSNED